MPGNSESGRYRRAVDTGRTRDKVAAPDPAAAPVHADAEASGQPTSGAASDAATERQRRQHVTNVPRVNHTVTGRGQAQIPGYVSAWLLGAGFAALGLLGLAAAYLSAP